MNGTDTPQAGASFPATPWSAILKTGDPADPSARAHLERLFADYWRPLYWWIRLQRGAPDEEARELLQEFFLHAWEKGLFPLARRERGRFRTFLLASLRNFLANCARDRRAKKKGGNLPHVRLPVLEEGADDWAPPAETVSPDQAYELCWIHCVLRRAWRRLESELRSSGRGDYAEIFRKVVLEPPPGGPPSYREVGREFSLDEVDVANRLKAVKHRLRLLVQEVVRDSVSTPEELEQEMRELFGSGL